MKMSDIKFDCRFFKGHIPCKPNKLFDAVCSDCKYYDRVSERILIIKLGASGDVIRTTPILYPLKKEYPNSKIYWITYSPDLVPKKLENKHLYVDEILNYNLQSTNFLKEIEFDLIINLDKDKEAISLVNVLQGKKKLGFTIKNGYCYPLNKNAELKFLSGLFDKISKENKKSYLEEIFEICGYKFNGEKYILDVDEISDKDWDIDKNKTVVGLNTGVGSRWISRLWDDDKWISLIHKLCDSGLDIILLGGSLEEKRNQFLYENSNAKYFGTYDLRTFINLMNKCDLIVTQVTMGLHIALGLNKKVVLINNIFNPNEFELYGNGIIVQPRKECKCYYSKECTNEEYKCMDYLMPEDVFESCKKLITQTIISY